MVIIAPDLSRIDQPFAMPSSIHASLHRSGVLSLYRHLLRQCKRMNVVPPLDDLDVDDCVSYHVRDELDDYIFDSGRYMHSLQSELKFNAREQFKRQHQSSDNEIEAFHRGLDLLQAVTSFIEAPSNNTLCSLITIMSELRQREYLRNQRRFDYLSKRHEIQETQAQSMDILEKRNLTLKKRMQAIAKAKRVTLYREMRRRMDGIMAESQINEDRLLQRFLKLRQQGGHIPNSLQLSYTPELSSVTANMARQKCLMHGSVRKKMLQAAYDPIYIDSIVKPSLHYDINKFHFLDKIDNTINVKGPQQVKIKTTGAGSVPIPYIKMAYPRLMQNKRVAMDCIRLTQVFSMIQDWHSTESPDLKASSALVTRRNKEKDEIIPRSYYAELAEAEALWEYMLELELAKSNDERGVLLQAAAPVLKQLKESHRRDWTQSLDDIDFMLREEREAYTKRYDWLKSDDSPLLDVQRELQMKQISYYTDMAQRYKAMLAEIDGDIVQKHLEIVTPLCERENRMGAITRYIKTGKDTDVPPSKERLGMGKTLADYLKRHGFKAFFWGQKFHDRFKFPVLLDGTETRDDAVDKKSS